MAGELFVTYFLFHLCVYACHAHVLVGNIDITRGCTLHIVDVYVYIYTFVNTSLRIHVYVFYIQSDMQITMMSQKKILQPV